MLTILCSCSNSAPKVYEYTNGQSNVAFGDTEEELAESTTLAEKLVAEGYVINFPTFENMDSQPNEIELAIYSAINVPIMDYANGIAFEYKNRAKLEYTVTQQGNSTLTIAFNGFGYFEEDAKEPVSLDRTFVFDIKDVGADRLPILVSS